MTNTFVVKTPKGREIVVDKDIYDQISSEDGLARYIAEHGRSLCHDASHQIAYYKHTDRSDLTYDLCLDCKDDYQTAMFLSRLFCVDAETTFCDTLEEGIEDMMMYVDEIEDYENIYRQSN